MENSQWDNFPNNHSGIRRCHFVIGHRLPMVLFQNLGQGEEALQNCIFNFFNTMLATVALINTFTQSGWGELKG